MQTPDIYSETLMRLQSEHRLRRIPNQANGLDLVSNDYMGLGARSAEFMPEYRVRFTDVPMSASASRLLQRDQTYHNNLESYLDSLYTVSEGECAEKRTLLFNSGYHANVGALSALSVPGVLIVSDKLAHASMIDGIRLGHGETARFPHNDIKALRLILERKAKDYRSVVIVTESVFSMDGDLAPLDQLVELKREFPNVILYVDEAHAFGVFGVRGLGLAEEKGLIGEIDIIIGTLGKAAAGSGAFIATTPLLKDYLINCARSFIFSTALPPSVIAWNQLMIEHLTGMNKERTVLKQQSVFFRKEIERITGIENPSRSQIIPIHAGSADRAIEIASVLQANGIDALPIRRPTVAAGTERIRISLSATLTHQDLRRVISAIEKAIH